ncbi:triose-phosphate isomerase [Patescibacteria group bacterium]
MKKNKKALIIANWKMNPATLAEAKSMYTKIRTQAGKMQNVQTVVCAPFIYLTELQKLTKGHRCVVGAQDVFYERSGAYTGEVSATMLQKMKMQYVIIGHSERRALGESDDLVSKKVLAALKEKINVVLCVGEEERDEAEYLHFLREQVKNSLANIPKARLNGIVIAYEPIWAVGEGKRPDTPEDTQETILFIRKVLAEIFDKKIAMSVPILYGGSVNSKNTQSFLIQSAADGLLIGRASLDAKQFGEILKIANSI